MERAASLGNYLAEQYIAYGFEDGSFEVIDTVTYYNPMNWNLVMDEPGNPNMFSQPLATLAIGRVHRSIRQ